MQTPIEPDISSLEALFRQAQNSAIAQQQTQYLKNKFVFLGLPNPLRRQLQQEWFQLNPILNETQLHQMGRALWHMEPREFHHTALNLIEKYPQLWTCASFDLLAEWARSNQWWDSIDTLASRLMGPLLEKYPELLPKMDLWIKDEDFWLRRVALIYQLKYKHATDETRLFAYCAQTLHEKEFFIRKAIGWALREYSKTNPQSVRQFIQSHRQTMSGLSLREASKYL